MGFWLVTWFFHLNFFFDCMIKLSPWFFWTTIINPKNHHDNCRKFVIIPNNHLTLMLTSFYHGMYANSFRTCFNLLVSQIVFPHEFKDLKMVKLKSNMFYIFTYDVCFIYEQKYKLELLTQKNHTLQFLNFLCMYLAIHVS